MIHLSIKRAGRALVAIAALPLGLAACHGGGDSGKAAMKNRPVLVTVAPVVQEDVPKQVTAIGTVEAVQTVSVRSQVGGQLLRVSFKQGDDVRKGQTLFEVDPRPAQAALLQAQAALQRDQAQERNASDLMQRYTALYKEGGVSVEQFNQYKTNLAAIQGTVGADKAAVENARVQLSYCTITAPISGRTGSLMVTEGNMVRANDTTAMVVINQLSPIYVTFSLPQNQLPDLQRYRAQGPLHVSVLPSGSTVPVSDGTVTFIDNSVDATTGTIKLRATFPNQDHRLWPGQFTNVTVRLSTIPNALLVPARAVQPGQQGSYVFVLKPDQTVDVRPVVTTDTASDSAIVSQGLQPGEQVVTDGLLQLRPGAKVKVVQPGMNAQEATGSPRVHGSRRHE